MRRRKLQFGLRWLWLVTLVASLELAFIIEAWKRPEVVLSGLLMQIGLLASGLFYYQHFRLRSWGVRHLRFENQLLGLCIAGLTYGGVVFLAALVSKPGEIETTPGVHHVQLSLLHLIPVWLIITLFGPFFAIVPGCFIKLVDRFIIRNHLKNLPRRQEGTIVGALAGVGAGIGLHVLFIPWTVATSCYLILLPAIIGGTCCYYFSGDPHLSNSASVG